MGKVKEEVGRAIDDSEMVTEGKVDQAASTVTRDTTADRVKRAVEDADRETR